MAYQTWTIATSVIAEYDDGESEQISYNVETESYPHTEGLGVRDFREFGELADSEHNDDGRLTMAVFYRGDMEYDRIEICTRVELSEIVN
jgi:hypothetical protein